MKLLCSISQEARAYIAKMEGMFSLHYPFNHLEVVADVAIYFGGRTLQKST